MLRILIAAPSSRCGCRWAGEHDAHVPVRTPCATREQRVVVG
jgi:hypothetical protein